MKKIKSIVEFLKMNVMQMMIITSIMGTITAVFVILDDDFLSKVNVEKPKALEVPIIDAPIIDAPIIDVPIIDVPVELEATEEKSCVVVAEKEEPHVYVKPISSVVDVEGWELINTRRIDENRVGYYYRRYGDIKEWYTIFRNESNTTN